MKIVILILFIILMLLLISFFSHVKDEEFIANAVSSDLKILFMTLDSLDEKILEDDKYLYMDQEKMKSIIKEASAYVNEIDNSLAEIRTLNSNYKFRRWQLPFLFMDLNIKLNEGKVLNEDDIVKLKRICELRVKYSSAKNKEIHDYDDNPFTIMKLPKEIDNLFIEIEEIYNAYSN